MKKRLLAMGLILVLAGCGQGSVKYTAEVVPCSYRKIGTFSQGLAWVRDDEERHSIIDQTGKEVAPWEYYDWCEPFSEDLAAVEWYGEWGFIDKTGGEVIPFQYKRAKSFSQGLAAVERYGKWGFIDKTGNEVIAFQYSEAGSFSEGLAAVEQDGKWKYIDQDGKVAVSCKLDYNRVGEFHEGLARARDESDRWGFLDKSGWETIHCQYKDVTDFDQGLAWVQDETGNWGAIDKEGEVVVPCKYRAGQYQDFFSEGMAVLRQRDDKQQQVCVDAKGREIFSERGTNVVSKFMGGKALIRRTKVEQGVERSRWSLIDTNGREVYTIPGDGYTYMELVGEDLIVATGKYESKDLIRIVPEN